MNPIFTFRTFFFLALLTLCWSACVPPTEYTAVEIDWTDPAVRRIYDLQTDLLADSMPYYLSSEVPSHRSLACLALGSMADSAKTYRHVDTLCKLLKDPVDDVRAAAAHALGLIGDPRAEFKLVGSYDRLDSMSYYVKANATILEAVGRCGSLSTLDNIATISTFTAEDSLLMLGQAFSIFRFGQRAISSPAGNATMLKIVQNAKLPETTRSVAAYHFARLEGFIPDSAQVVALSNVLAKDPAPGVRMMLSRALSGTPLGQPALVKAFASEKDERVRVAIIRALGKQPYALSRTTLFTALRDPEVSVSSAAADLIGSQAIVSDGAELALLAGDKAVADPVRIRLQGAMLSRLPYIDHKGLLDSINTGMMARLATEPNTNLKIDLMRALAPMPANFETLMALGTDTKSLPAIKTTATEVIGGIVTDPIFYLKYKGRNKLIREQVFGFLLSQIRTRDAGTAAVAAEALRKPEAGFLPLLRDSSLFILTEAQKQLKIPAEIETYNAIQATINAATGIKTPDKKPDTAPKIDWDIIENLVTDPQITITTTKGDIVLLLERAASPAAVTTFIQQVKKGALKDKFFHRVVPAFVVQTGCPRGDGYGSPDFALRSMLDTDHFLHEGMLGMASAGPHTESSQWFITLGPAIHLDGRYTRFGRVIEGMDVARKLDQNDIIKQVTLGF
jgi:cyclophilin family peptidyl-prolyl cis-trans isomerase/HEAT repeat protein